MFDEASNKTGTTFNIIGFVELSFAAAIFENYGSKNVKKITFNGSDGIYYSIYDGAIHTLSEKDIQSFISKVSELSEDEDSLLSFCCDLIIKYINHDTICKIVFNTDAIPRHLYKYISNESKHLSDFFKMKLSFVHKDCFDDVYDCDIDYPFYCGALIDRMRILCLSKRHNIEALWGTYANKYNGFCFSYSNINIEKGLLNAFSNGNLALACADDVIYDLDNYLKKVNRDYTNSPKINDVFDKILRSIVRCFIKDKSWGYQEEYRIILLGEFDKNYFTTDMVPSAYYYNKKPNKKVLGSKDTKFVHVGLDRRSE